MGQKQYLLTEEQRDAFVSWANARDRGGRHTRWGPCFDAALRVACELRDMQQLQAPGPNAELCEKLDQLRILAAAQPKISKDLIRWLRSSRASLEEEPRSLAKAAASLLEALAVTDRRIG